MADDMNIPIHIDTVLPVEQTENCILEICCNPVKSMQVLAHKLHTDAGLKSEDAAAAAQWIKDHYDLAPKLSLKMLRESFAANARDYPYE